MTQRVGNKITNGLYKLSESTKEATTATVRFIKALDELDMNKHKKHNLWRKQKREERLKTHDLPRLPR